MAALKLDPRSGISISEGPTPVTEDLLPAQRTSPGGNFFLTNDKPLDN